MKIAESISEESAPAVQPQISTFAENNDRETVLPGRRASSRISQKLRERDATQKSDEAVLEVACNIPVSDGSR